MERHFQAELLDYAKLIKVNDLKEITNPIYFVRNGIPTDDGLLSNSIFGISKAERANIFAYIDLGEYFLAPLAYKILTRMERKIREIVHGTQKYIINSEGELIQDDEKGKCGLKFLKDNFDQLKFRDTGSKKRDTNTKFILENKNVIFTKQFIVIPAYFRDVNTDRGRVGVGEINEMYDKLIIAVRALKETADYGLSMSDATRGRIQELLLQIYDWFTKEPNIGQKKGILRRSNMSKTTDYASRLVLSAPDLKVERLEDLPVDLDHSAVPLASLCANLYPYMVFWIRRFFENEFSGTGAYPYMTKEGEIKYLKVKDPLIVFSDDRIKKELERFIKGYSNRFIPIEVPNDEGKRLFMYFKGRSADLNNLNNEEIKTPLIRRRLTWCDLFFMAANEMSRDKVALITRYPMDSNFNQFPTQIVVASTKETEAVYIDGTLYKRYPKIREEDIGKDTSNKFIDTLNITNLMLKMITGDYDG